jgi:hypothetical protein
MKNSVASLLEHDHESLDEVLTQLDEELAKSNIVRAFELLDFFWARLAVHIRGENLHLFPAIESAPTSLFTGKDCFPTREEAQSVLARLRADHDFFMKELALVVKSVREVVASETLRSEKVVDVKRRVTKIKKRLEAHNQLEEKRAYTWPALLFNENTITELRESLKRELENLPPRFSQGK